MTATVSICEKFWRSSRLLFRLGDLLVLIRDDEKAVVAETDERGVELRGHVLALVDYEVRTLRRVTCRQTPGRIASTPAPVIS